MAKKKARKPKPRRYSAEAPLELSCSVVVEGEAPNPRARWSGPLALFVGSLPSYRLSPGGKQVAAAVKIGLGFAAVGLVAAGREQAVLGALGVVVALAALLLPLSELRKRRWREAAAVLARPVVVRRTAPARVHFDGDKLSVLLEGRVRGSIRPSRAPPAELRLGPLLEAPEGAGATELAALGFVRGSRKKGERLWFLCTEPLREDLPWEGREPVQGFVPERSATVDAEGFAALFEAFVHRLADRPQGHGPRAQRDSREGTSS